MNVFIIFLFIILHTVIDATGDAFGYKAKYPEFFKWKYHNTMSHLFQGIQVFMKVFLVTLIGYKIFEFSFNNKLNFIVALLSISVSWTVIRFAVFDPVLNVRVVQ